MNILATETDLYACETHGFQHASVFILYIYTQMQRDFACNMTTRAETDQQKEDEGGPLEPSVSVLRKPDTPWKP